MSLDRITLLEQALLDAIHTNDLPACDELKDNEHAMSSAMLYDLLDSQIKSRCCDYVARELKEQGLSFYTIGSAGHEGNAVLGLVFPYTDIAFLHYRSGAFFVQRAKQKKLDGVELILMSLVAAKAEPISAGRHKVFGSVELNIPPQTSTIASHLPKALGAALSLTRAKELNIKRELEDDSVVLVSFGDASFNHASTQTTLNAAAWLSQNNYPLPLVFVCEDNGIGISTPIPKGFIKQRMIGHPGIEYIEVNGLDPIDYFAKAQLAQTIARQQHRAVFLHVHCVRLLGHAGSDIETQYLTTKQIEQTEKHDPLLYTVKRVLERGELSSCDILTRYKTLRREISDSALRLAKLDKLDSAKAVMESIQPRTYTFDNYPLPNETQRKQLWGQQYKQLSQKRTLQQQLTIALSDILLQYPHSIMLGEDIGKKGGVYRVTAGLQQQFGARRVFDTILDETTILGSAIGLAHNGFVPIVEIQFLAYLHNAIDQLRGEAATLSFFSDGQYKNPMVIRIASLAYQKGFGGHFHNDNSFAAIRDIPGLIIACPSNGRQAAGLLRQCFKLAHEKGCVVVFLEPIALYMTKDLMEKGDQLWLTRYPDLNYLVEPDTVNEVGEGETVIISYANGFFLSCQAQQVLRDKHQCDIKIIDLMWLKPLPMNAVIKSIANAKRVLVVDEGRRTGSISEELLTCLHELLPNKISIKRLCGQDSFIPLGNAWEYVLPSKDDIVDAVINW